MTGYLGREIICEVLLLNDQIRALIMARATAREILQAAVRQGMKTMRQDGWLKVRGGATSAAEVLQATQE